MKNKKIAFLTRHTVPNYGSVLQAYATQEAIKKLGHKPVCIDYFRTDEKPENVVTTRLKASKWNKNFLTRFIFKITQKPSYTLADKRFAEYRKIVKVTSIEYNHEQELCNNCPEADIYMTGSDQVWNTVVCGELDPVYFLSFVSDSEKKLAYAASFGGNLTNEQKNFMAPYLKRYDFISVRENSGVRLAGEMGVNAERVLDPTFLLNTDEWSKIIPKRERKEKYVLVYQLHPNREFEKYAKNFAKNKGLKLIRISQFFHHAVRSGRFVCCPPIEDFLWYIKNADCFLTDSFHGTAFAIGLNTQFIDVLPKAYSERISSILSLIGYENRILKDYSDFNTADEDIDYQKVNKIIESERKKSFDILRKMLGD